MSENNDESSIVIRGIKLESYDLVDIGMCSFNQHMCEFLNSELSSELDTMSQYSNSEAPLLVEEETTAHPTTWGSM